MYQDLADTRFHVSRRRVMFYLSFPLFVAKRLYLQFFIITKVLTRLRIRAHPLWPCQDRDGVSN